MRKTSRIYIIALLLIIMIFTISNVSYGRVEKDAGGVGQPSEGSEILTEDYNPGTPTDTEEIVDKAVPLINILLTFGVIVGVVGISLLGLRYMLGSAQEKAEYKETMMPFIFGAVFIFSVCGALRIINVVFEEGTTFEESRVLSEGIIDGDIAVSELEDIKLKQIYSYNQISRNLGEYTGRQGKTLSEAVSMLSKYQQQIYTECKSRGLLNDSGRFKKLII